MRASRKSALLSWSFTVKIQAALTDVKEAPSFALELPEEGGSPCFGILIVVIFAHRDVEVNPKQVAARGSARAASEPKYFPSEARILGHIMQY